MESTLEIVPPPTLKRLLVSSHIRFLTSLTFSLRWHDLNDGQYAQKIFASAFVFMYFHGPKTVVTGG